MVKIKPLKNGRSASSGPGFASVPVEMMATAAFQSLAASSIRVLLYCLRLNYGATTYVARKKGPTGKPTFKLTNQMARELLNMSPQTFTTAKNELAEKGFIEWAVRGGLMGCNGIASQFALSSQYKDWTPPAKPRKFAGLERARATLKEKTLDPQPNQEKSLPHGKTLKSVKPA